MNKNRLLLLGFTAVATVAAIYLIHSTNYFTDTSSSPVIPNSKTTGEEEDSFAIKTTGDEEDSSAIQKSKTTGKEKKEYFLIVSAVSSNHFKESKDMIGSAQKYLPKRRIMMYDLGLEKEQRKELETFCNVELRTFDFNKYPEYFRSLFKYAWKPVIIKTVAQETEYLFWADSSIRFIPNFESALKKLDKFPIKGHHHELDIVQVTHSGMLDYFNMTRESMRNLVGIEGGLVLYKTNNIAMHIIDLWCDCSMHEECIAPKNTIHWPCKFELVKKGSIQFIGCHRFDQSALNVAIFREYGREVYKYILDSVIDTSLKVYKHPTNDYPVKKC